MWLIYWFIEIYTCIVHFPYLFVHNFFLPCKNVYKYRKQIFKTSLAHQHATWARFKQKSWNLSIPFPCCWRARGEQEKRNSQKRCYVKQPNSSPHKSIWCFGLHHRVKMIYSTSWKDMKSENLLHLWKTYHRRI